MLYFCPGIAAVLAKLCAADPFTEFHGVTEWVDLLPNLNNITGWNYWFETLTNTHPDRTNVPEGFLETQAGILAGVTPTPRAILEAYAGKPCGWEITLTRDATPANEKERTFTAIISHWQRLILPPADATLRAVTRFHPPGLSWDYFYIPVSRINWIKHLMGEEGYEVNLTWHEPNAGQDYCRAAVLEVDSAAASLGMVRALQGEAQAAGLSYLRALPNRNVCQLWFFFEPAPVPLVATVLAKICASVSFHVYCGFKEWVYLRPILDTYGGGEIWLDNLANTPSGQENVPEASLEAQVGILAGVTPTPLATLIAYAEEYCGQEITLTREAIPVSAKERAITALISQWQRLILPPSGVTLQAVAQRHADDFNNYYTCDGFEYDGADYDEHYTPTEGIDWVKHLTGRESYAVKLEWLEPRSGANLCRVGVLTFTGYYNTNLHLPNAYRQVLTTLTKAHAAGLSCLPAASDYNYFQFWLFCEPAPVGLVLAVVELSVPKICGHASGTESVIQQTKALGCLA
jgi:hypothetical protein